MIYLYDWTITGKWEGVYDDSASSSSSSPLISGTFEINGLSDENDVDEIDVEILTTDTSDEGFEFKTLVRNVGIIIIRQTLQKYIDELKRDFAKDLIKPMTTTTTKTSSPPPKMETKLNGVVTTSTAKTKSPIGHNSATPPPSSSISSNSSSASTSGPLSTTRLSISDTFRCDDAQLFNFLTNPQLILAWTQSPVDFELTRGAAFRLFDGNVTGVVADFQTGVQLNLQWRFKSWRPDHLSDVSLKLEKLNDGRTTIRLEHSGVPAEEKEATIEGWKRNIFKAIKATFGVGDLNVS